MSAEAKIEFGCHPLEQGFNSIVEGALVTTEGDSTVLTYYTTSETWGAVDEWTETANFSKSASIVSVESANASLVIDLKKLVGGMEGEFTGVLTVPSKNIQAEMICNEGEY